MFRRKSRLYLVFEYMEQDMLSLLNKYPNGLPQEMVRSYMQQVRYTD